jgi:hypothetical protein
MTSDGCGNGPPPVVHPLERLLGRFIWLRDGVQVLEDVGIDPDVPHVPPARAKPDPSSHHVLTPLVVLPDRTERTSAPRQSDRIKYEEI